MVPLLSSLAAEDRRGLVMVEADAMCFTRQTTFGRRGRGTRERDRSLRTIERVAYPMKANEHTVQPQFEEGDKS